MAIHIVSSPKLAVAVDVVAENLRALIGTKPLAGPAKRVLRGEIKKLQGISDTLAVLVVK